MSFQIDNQYNIEKVIEHAIALSIDEVNNLCPNVACEECEFRDDCVSNYRNRMKAMFLKGAIFACLHEIPSIMYCNKLNKMTNNE